MHWKKISTIDRIGTSGHRARKSSIHLLAPLHIPRKGRRWLNRNFGQGRGEGFHSLCQAFQAFQISGRSGKET